MKFVWGLVLLFVLSIGGEAQAQGKQDFVLANGTGYTIRSVYLAPSKSDSWGDDVWGKEVFEDGEESEINFSRKERDCLWDLKVVWQDDGTSSVWYELDLCKINKITLKYNKRTDTTTAVTE
jgi:hypothetical protein